MNKKNTAPKSLVLANGAPKKFGKKPTLVDTRGSEKMEIDYFRFYESLYRKEVDDWLAARAARRDPFNPITFGIQQLYKDAMLDNHLQGAIENRILRVINKEFVIMDANGNIDRKRSAQLQTRWFRHIIRRAIESKFYGYSLILCTDLSITQRQVVDLPRENVIPEKGILVKNAFNPNSEAIPYREFPNHLIYIQLGSDAIGTLERIAPLTIFKRHSWAAWDQFEQVFGLPIRIARTMINTQKHRDDLQMWLETMGTSSYAIFDKQTEIELKENQRTDAFKVFYEKVQAINKEISKGVVGQTMTMDDGSSQSQANVHLQIYDEITSSDITDVQDWVTDDFFPVLRNHGFDIPEGFYFSIIEKQVIKPLDKIKIDQMLLQNGYNIKADYIEEFYGTPLDEAEPRAQPQQQQTLNLNQPITDFFV